MSITQTEAEETLRQINRTTSRSAQWLHAQFAAPHLILWGLVWGIGYGAVAINPEWSVIWMVLGPLGGLASFIIGWRLSRRAGIGTAQKAGLGGILARIAPFAAVFAFFQLSIMILQPMHAEQIGAFVPLVIGLIYVMGGAFPRLTRIFYLGVGLMALTAIGYYFVRDYFYAWMAIVGAGALVLGGLWLRSV